MESGEAAGRRRGRTGREGALLPFSHTPGCFYFFLSFFFFPFSFLRSRPPRIGGRLLVLVYGRQTACGWWARERGWRLKALPTHAPSADRRNRGGVILQRVERLENIAKVSETRGWVMVWWSMVRGTASFPLPTTGCIQNSLYITLHPLASSPRPSSTSLRLVKIRTHICVDLRVLFFPLRVFYQRYQLEIAVLLHTH